LNSRPPALHAGAPPFSLNPSQWLLRWALYPVFPLTAVNIQPCGQGQIEQCWKWAKAGGNRSRGQLRVTPRVLASGSRDAGRNPLILCSCRASSILTTDYALFGAVPAAPPSAALTLRTGTQSHARADLAAHDLIAVPTPDSRISRTTVFAISATSDGTTPVMPRAPG